MKRMKIEYKIDNDKTYRKWNKERTEYKDYKFTKKSIKKILSYISDCISRYGTDDNGYVNIPMNNIRNIHNGELILECLRMDGLIERSYYSVEKKKAFGYRFSETFADSLEILKIQSEPNDFYIDNTIKKECSVKSIELVIDPDVLNRVEKDFDSVEFIDEFIDKEYNGKFIHMSRWLGNNLRYDRWKKGIKSYTWSSNRLYTNFVFLSKQARLSHIRLNGEEIVEFDIPNSFPLMLSLYCLKMNPEIKYDYEFREYAKSVVKGNFYGKLCFGLNSIRNCSKEGEYEDNGDKVVGDYSTRFITKNAAKKAFQVFLNDKTERNAYVEYVSVDVKKYMAHNYSSLYDVVKSIKEESKVYDVLVSNETKIIFDIIKELYNTFEDIKILTCHDAIYVPKSYEERVRVIWDKWMNKMYKQLPQDEYKQVLDIEDWIERC